MTPEDIRPLLENARVVHARLYDCVEALGRLRVVVVVSLAVFVRMYPPRRSRTGGASDKIIID